MPVPCVAMSAMDSGASALLAARLGDQWAHQCSSRLRRGIRRRQAGRRQPLTCTSPRLHVAMSGEKHHGSVVDAAVALMHRVLGASLETPLQEVARRWRALHGSSVGAALVLQLAAGGAFRRTALATGSPEPRRRRARIANGDAEMLEVTPYSEVYGLHPRDFVFDRRYNILPVRDARGFVGFASHQSMESSDEDDDDADDIGDDDVRVVAM